MDLNERIDSVVNKETFINFMEALIDDYKNKPEEWENLSIDMFLDAINRWAEDFNFRDPDINFERPDWKTIAILFYMGKIYE